MAKISTRVSPRSSFCEAQERRRSWMRDIFQKPTTRAGTSFVLGLISPAVVQVHARDLSSRFHVPISRTSLVSPRFDRSISEHTSMTAMIMTASSTSKEVDARSSVRASCTVCNAAPHRDSPRVVTAFSWCFMPKYVVESARKHAPVIVRSTPGSTKMASTPGSRCECVKA